MTAFSGFWDEQGDQVPHALLVNESSLRKRMSILMRQRGNTALKELMLTTNGVAVGQAALATRTKVTGVSQLGELGIGGAVVIAAEDVVNRVSATADTTAIAAMLNETRAPATYPVDLSGNGGGGKGGF